MYLKCGIERTGRSRAPSVHVMTHIQRTFELLYNSLRPPGPCNNFTHQGDHGWCLDHVVLHAPAFGLEN